MYEQFAGFHALEPLIIADVARRRPVAADLLLGRDRVRGAQVVKQADVLMLHHMVPDATAAGSLVPNLELYEPRTAHGSSLSPGVRAALFARAGRLDEAVAMLGLTARLDLDDLTRTTAGGLRLAAMGSLWQALVFGFAGVRARSDGLPLDPHVPESWGPWRSRSRIEATGSRSGMGPDALRIEAERPLVVRLSGAPLIHVAGPLRCRRSDGI